MIINANMLLAAYPVGSLYLTTNEINPGTLFGGTWEKLTGDAYLKIVTSNPGQYNGTSDQHKIPVNSMPSHRHGNRVTLNMTQGAGQDRNIVLGGGEVWSVTDTYQNQFVGGGQPYYPYYYGIYVWRRVA